MQDNTITLSVDLANDSNPSNQAFVRFEELSNRSTYNGPGHTLAAPHTMQLYRTLPKRAGSSLGTARSSVKFTKNVTVVDADGNDVIRPLIAEVTFSVPVGTTAAETLAIRQHIISALDLDAVAADLIDALEI